MRNLSKSHRPAIQQTSMATERDQGDGATTEEEDVLEHSSQQSEQNTDVADTRPSPSKPFSIHMEVDVLQWCLFAMAIVTRMWRLEHPRAIVFDELHYGRFAAMYLKKTFFFDVHPPLGKLFITAAAHYAGFDGDFKFEKIGAEYSYNVPVLAMRFMPAVCGSLLVPVTYQVMSDLRFSRWTAALAAILVIVDNAILVQSRFMLLEGMLLCFMALTLLSYLKFSRISIQEQFSVRWWFWLVCLGMALTCTILTKYSGALTVFMVLGLVARDMWRLLPHTSISDVQLGLHALARVTVLGVMPVLLYTSVFYVHLSLLTKAGPHDGIMTSAFQASLEGGLAAITKGQPLHIGYGSQVTLRHTHSRPCWLHSHKAVYPIRYPDKRGSSHQQQVTCYTYKDVNNWWIIKNPESKSLMVDDPVQPVKHGDVIQLIHGMTSRALNSHDVAAPVSPQHQEVSCYVDYNISIPAQNLWRVDIVNREEEGDVWQTIKSHVRLVHVNTTQALKVSGKHLPDWGFYQLEVVTDRIVKQEPTVWNVEEHRYTQSPDQDDREKELRQAELIPTAPTQLSFFSKFTELQLKMLLSRHDANLEHKYSSGPLEWPFMDRNVAYWVQPQTNAQIHLLGNMLVWCSGATALLVYSGLLLFYVLRRRRECWDIEAYQWSQFSTAGEFPFLGYLVNFVPYFLTERTLFIHHYIPALYFKILLVPAVIEHIHTLISWCKVAKLVLYVLVVLWLVGIICVFLTFVPVTYGFWALTPTHIKQLTWRNTWDLLIFPNKL